MAERANIDEAIERFVRGNEGMRQKEVLADIRKETGLSERSLRTHLRRLDGRTIHRAREGRDLRIYSREHWGRMAAQHDSGRASHTQRLKMVLDLFREELPVPDDFGVVRGRRASFVGGLRMEYRPDQALAVEGHVLFPDLLYHLAQLDLPVTEVWFGEQGFRAKAVEYAELAAKLRARCTQIVKEAFRPVPFSESWSSEVVSDNCVRLLHQRTLAMTSGGYSAWPANESALEIRQEGGWLECWWHGNGLARRAATRRKPDQFKRWVYQRLCRIESKAREELLPLSQATCEARRRLEGVRATLDRRLEEASYYETFPGSCRFLGLAST